MGFQHRMGSAFNGWAVDIEHDIHTGYYSTAANHGERSEGW